MTKQKESPAKRFNFRQHISFFLVFYFTQIRKFEHVFRDIAFKVFEINFYLIPGLHLECDLFIIKGQGDNARHFVDPGTRPSFFLDGHVEQP